MKISLKNAKNGLKRDVMRTITGGNPIPFGDNDDGSGGSGGGGGGGSTQEYMCCWKGTNNCSTCNRGNVCTTGAVLRRC